VERDCCAAIRAGETQTSLGYTAILAGPSDAELQPDGSGLWAGPHGPEAYDLEHLLDPEDPRVVAYAQDDPTFSPSDLGGNHLAVAIRRGVGGPLSELLTIVDAADAIVGANRVTWLTRAESLPATPTKANMADITPKIHVVEFAPPRGSKIARFTCDMEPDAAARLRELFAAFSAELEKALGMNAELEVKLDGAMGAQEVAAASATEAQAGLAAATDQLGAKTAMCDALLAEVAPLRVKALADARSLAVRLGVPRAEADAAPDLASLQVAWAKVKAPKAHAIGSGAIAGAWTYAVDSLPADEPSRPAAPSAGFQNGFKREETDAAPSDPNNAMVALLAEINGAPGAKDVK